MRFIRWFQVCPVLTGLKHFLINRDRLKVMSITLVPKVLVIGITKCVNLIPHQALCCGSKVQLKEGGRKQWKIWELISSWKTLYMFAGQLFQSKQLKLFLVF